LGIAIQLKCGGVSALKNKGAKASSSHLIFIFSDKKETNLALLFLALQLEHYDLSFSPEVRDLSCKALVVSFGRQS